MLLKDPSSGALLNIDNFKTISPIDDQPKFQTKIIFDIEGGCHFEAATTCQILLDSMKQKRLFILCDWKQKWS